MTAPNEPDDKLFDAIQSGRVETVTSDPDLAKALAAHQKLEGLFELLRGPVRENQNEIITVGTPTSSGLRFRILRPHAKGGLGEVFVALDEELHREVALKEIQGRFADNPESRSRFVLEAEITGGLEHPGIVPVYGLGQYTDGRPFYAMRFIRGDSLKEAVERFHQAEIPGRDSGARTLALRKLLGRFLDVCNAMAYAHSRGILHRDLKPGNIMLGQYGETLVVDWGLAKPLDRQEGVPGVGEVPLKPASGSGVTPTQMGSALGTPQYMSPEQAAGRLDLLGPATDVYSLGATLYTLLTGKTPFADRDVGVLLQKVQKGDFIPPRRVNPSAPRPLEAICLKAMALAPQDRYTSPRAMADDIDHWLADEPTSAWREPMKERFRRWVGRHRTMVTAFAAAVLVAMMSLVIATVLLTAANERERLAKELALQREEETKRQREIATKNFELARKAVDQYCTKVSESKELKTHGLEQLRKDLLRSAVEFYQEFSRQRGDDREVRAERGSAFGRLALLTAEISPKQEAIKLCQEALTIFEKLVQDYPDMKEYQSELAGCHNFMGNLYHDTGRRDQAEIAYRKALLINQKLGEGYFVKEDNSGLFRIYNDLGGLFKESGRNKEASEAFGNALKIVEKHSRKNPLDNKYQEQLAGIHNNLASLYSTSRQTDKAEEAYRKALSIYEKLVKNNPAETNYQQELTTVYINIGVFLGSKGRLEEAEAALTSALGISDKLSRNHPEVTRFQVNLASVHYNIGCLYRERRRLDQAEAAYLKALPIQEKLAISDSTVTEYAIDLGNTLADLGRIVRLKGKYGIALNWYNKAVHILENQLKREENNVQARQSLVIAYRGRATTLGQLDRDEESLEDWDRAFELGDIQAKSEVAISRGMKISILQSEAQLLARFGNHSRATACAEVLAKRKSTSPDYFYNLAFVYSRSSVAVFKDAALSQIKQKQLAEKYAVRAVELLTKSHEAGQFKTRKDLENLQNEKGFESLRSRKDFQKLLADLEKAIKPQEKK